MNAKNPHWIKVRTTFDIVDHVDYETKCEEIEVNRLEVKNLELDLDERTKVIEKLQADALSQEAIIMTLQTEIESQRNGKLTILYKSLTNP